MPAGDELQFDKTPASQVHVVLVIIGPVLLNKTPQPSPTTRLGFKKK